MKYRLSISVLVAGILLVFGMSGTAGKHANPTSTAGSADNNAAQRAGSSGQRETSITPVSASPQSGEQINWQVISSGGTKGTSASFILNSTVGQTVVGEGSSASFILSHGFWQNFGDTSCCIGITGNADGDPGEIVDIGDLTRLIDYLFISFTPPECMPEANVDGSTDGVVDIGDVTKLIDYLFISYTPPASCP